jgi:hypothetical protein
MLDINWNQSRDIGDCLHTYDNDSGFEQTSDHFQAIDREDNDSTILSRPPFFVDPKEVSMT